MVTKTNAKQQDVGVMALQHIRFYGGVILLLSAFSSGFGTGLVGTRSILPAGRGNKIWNFSTLPPVGYGWRPLKSIKLWRFEWKRKFENNSTESSLSVTRKLWTHQGQSGRVQIQFGRRRNNAEWFWQKKNSFQSTLYFIWLVWRDDKVVTPVTGSRLIIFRGIIQLYSFIFYASLFHVLFFMIFINFIYLKK